MNNISEKYDPRWDIAYIGSKALTAIFKGVAVANINSAREEGDYRKERNSELAFDILDTIDETEDKLYQEYKRRQRKKQGRT